MAPRRHRRPKNLADKLVAIRHKLGMSRSQLAALIVYSDKGAARISDYEDETRRPSSLVLLNYAKLARISLELLVNDNLELVFPRTWKGSKHPEALLMQDKVLLSNMPMAELQILSLYSVHDE